LEHTRFADTVMINSTTDRQTPHAHHFIDPSIAHSLTTKAVLARPTVSAGRSFLHRNRVNTFLNKIVTDFDKMTFLALEIFQFSSLIRIQINIKNQLHTELRSSNSIIGIYYATNPKKHGKTESNKCL
jgi:hypothetical protein